MADGNKTLTPDEELVRICRERRLRDEHSILDALEARHLRVLMRDGNAEEVERLIDASRRNGGFGPLATLEIQPLRYEGKLRGVRRRGAPEGAEEDGAAYKDETIRGWPHRRGHARPPA